MNKLMIGFVFLMLGMSFNSIAQQANFEGVWKRNDWNTQMPEGLSINSIPYQLDIKQDNSRIIVLKYSTTATGNKTSYADSLLINGKPSEVTTPNNYQRVSTIVLAADGKSFTQVAASKDAQNIVRQHWNQTFQLSQDGKTLTITADVSYDGEAEVRIIGVYEKQ